MLPEVQCETRVDCANWGMSFVRKHLSETGLLIVRRIEVEGEHFLHHFTSVFICNVPRYWENRVLSRWNREKGYTRLNTLGMEGL